MTHMTPDRFRFLMRSHGWTIRTLAKSAGVTHDRVRELRAEGIYVGTGRGEGYAATSRIAELNVWGWTEILNRRHKMAA